jgi:tRNA(fMet)-specific endonuclease VapC
VIQLDSSFLIDLQQELKKERPGAALEFIESLDARELLAVSVHVAAELRVGAELARRPLEEHEAVDNLLAGLLVLYPDSRFAPQYGRLWAATNRRGRAVAAMHLLIATTALLEDAPLVTRNVKDFSRVPGLRVLGY